MKAVPIMATSTVVMAALAAANERLRKGAGRRAAAWCAAPRATQADEQHHGGGEQGEDAGREPAPRVALDERQGDAEEAGGHQADAGEVHGLS